MSLRERLAEQGKRLSTSAPVVRLISDDRFAKVAEGVVDGRQRIRAAREKVGEAVNLLLHGRALPSVDLSAVQMSSDEGATKPRTAATNGHAAPARAEQSELKMDGIETSIESRTSLANVGGKDVFEKCFQYTTTDNARKMGIYPFFRPLDKNDGPEAILDGKRVLMLGSNNYLGLTTHPKVREAAADAIREYGTSMTGSRLVNGSMKLHNELEDRFAAYMGKESALVFTTGYQVNIATLSALLSNKKSVAVIDRDDHASIYDGVRLSQASGARMVRYKHNEPESLRRALESLAPDEGGFVISDGVFSAEGDVLRLPEMLPIIKEHKARLFIDDAHGLGVIGPLGRGTAHSFGLEKDVDLIGGTFSKSLASIGGWLVGERKVIDYIKHFAPSFMFAASAAPASVAAAIMALELLQGEESWRIAKVMENATYMRNGLKSLGFDVGKSETSVIPVYVRQDLRTIMMWKELLEEHGVYTNPFISPGVPPKQARLRTSYMATHTQAHLDRGLDAFAKVGKKYGIILRAISPDFTRGSSLPHGGGAPRLPPNPSVHSAEQARSALPHGGGAHAPPPAAPRLICVGSAARSWSSASENRSFAPVGFASSAKAGFSAATLTVGVTWGSIVHAGKALGSRSSARPPVASLDALVN